MFRIMYLMMVVVDGGYVASAGRCTARKGPRSLFILLNFVA